MQISKLMYNISKVLNNHNILHRIKVKNQKSLIINEGTNIFDTEVVILMKISENNKSDKKKN